MKKAIRLLFIIFTLPTYAQTIHWGNTEITTCENGGDIVVPNTIPNTPTNHRFVGWKQGLRQIEYLESTGKQYIDTNVVANQTTEAEIEYEWVKSHNGILFMAGASWSQSNFGINVGGSVNIFLFYMNCDGWTNMQVNNSSSFPSGNIKLLLNGLYLNDEKMTISKGRIPSSTNFSTKYPIYIFAQNASGKAQFPNVFKLKYFKLWNNNNIVRDFIPVLDADDTACLYDKINNKLYYNSGTGDFIAGPIVGSTNEDTTIYTNGDIITNACNNDNIYFYPVFEPCENGYFAPTGSSICYPHILHVGDNNIYLKQTKQTTPSLNIKIGNDIFYANMTQIQTVMNKDSTQYFKVRTDDNLYYVCDDTTCGE